MPHFQIVTVDGDALGPMELGRPDWPAGSVIYTGPGEPNLRVKAVKGVALSGGVAVALARSVE